MVTVRKLTADEIADFDSDKKVSSRTIMAELFDSLLSEYSAGDFAAIVLGEGETKPSVRRHVNAALDRRNLAACWRRGTNDTLKFQVIDPAIGNGHNGHEG